MNQARIEPPSPIIHSLHTVNYLCLKAIQAKSRETLIFIILNDTINLIRYDRALLWDFTQKDPVLLGISGESTVNKNSPLVKKWKSSILDIKEPQKPQILSFTPLSTPKGEEATATMLWLPVFVEGKMELGLWLELWEVGKDSTPPPEIINLLMNFLMPTYGTSWKKLNAPYAQFSKLMKASTLYIIGAVILTLSFLIPTPLRIVCPCEIVPKDPVLITAPLEGVIETIHVKPGEIVAKDTPLFEYEKSYPLKELEVARKQVEVLQSEVKRASTLGYHDQKVRTDLSILGLKLEKERANLDLAEFRAGHLIVESPINGVVVLDNPDEWRGKPVRIGEKILAVTDPKDCKVRIWMPEGDNVEINRDVPITIYLNVSPEQSHNAMITYIANETVISDHQIPSFITEAHLTEMTPDIKLGLKGTAVLYGDKVSLFYYVMRKPWALLRRFTGV